MDNDRVNKKKEGKTDRDTLERQVMGQHLRNIEGAHAAVDKKVGIVDLAISRISVGILVDTDSQRQCHSDRNEPTDGNHAEHARLIPLLGILNRLCHCYESAHTHTHTHTQV